MTDTIIYRLNYRGVQVDFYDDPDGNQVYAFWDGHRLDFGAFNGNYVADAKRMIDQKLDTVYKFNEYMRTKLQYFLNGQKKDIRLISRNRLLRVYLLEEWPDTEAVIEDARKLLQKLYGASEK